MGDAAVEGPVLYQKLQLWESSLEEEEEDEISELLVPDPWRPQEAAGNQAGGLPGTWPRIAAALLLLVVVFSLATKRLQSSGSPPAPLGSAAPPRSGHTHRPGVYHHGAVISHAAPCSHLARELLAAGGNVVDAGVGAALCLAVVHPHATGLGALFWGLFHNGSSGNTSALVPGPAQTLAPGLGLPLALPGLALLHTHFGHLPWSHLLEGPATLAQEGFLVDTALAEALAAWGAKGLCPLFCQPDGRPLGAGAQATNPKLAKVLRKAALAPDPRLAGEALLGPLARDLGLEAPPAGPLPTLQPALPLPVRQGLLFTTPSPSAGPELLALLGEALHTGRPRPAPCPPLSPVPPGSSVLATVDSSGSVLLLASSLNGSFGSGRLSPSTGVLLSKPEAWSAAQAWACPLIFRDNSDDTEVDVLGLVASDSPTMTKAMSSALLSHLAASQPQPRQGQAAEPHVCGQGTLLQVAVHAEHVHVSSVPKDCCPFAGL
ncbi:glutathione hydrolase 6 [Sorex fumeus]|uniref:glutathione hydrolase 6 n=1 Tax=Sorex fumeus TaxID=62283 RepID=UPI0024ADF69C|nr:glutathione hydrolase 6 [Sorex fumeus]